MNTQGRRHQVAVDRLEPMLVVIVLESPPSRVVTALLTVCFFW
jgi:hypothetical protein